MTPNPLALPDGVHAIAERYRSVVGQSLQSEGLEHGYISAFHVEPRGSSFLVGFRVGLATGDEIFIYVEPDSRNGTPPNKNLAEGQGQPLVVWEFPSDPKLDSLASVVNTEALGVLFTRLKLGWVPSSAELLTYRPGRRAMVRCSDGTATAFAKAIRPHRAARVVVASTLALDAGLPVPHVIGWSPAGIAVYQTAVGGELSRAYETGMTGKMAINTALETLFSLETVTTDVPSRTPIINNFSWYFARAIQAHPAEKSVLTKLEEKIRASKFAEVTGENTTTIHGDLHLGQIFVTNESARSVSGIIDLDDMGVGLVGDDIAGLWANCVASSYLNIVESAESFWHECLDALGGIDLPPATDRVRLHCSIATHLVAQTLSTRGLNPQVARGLIDEATDYVN